MRQSYKGNGGYHFVVIGLAEYRKKMQPVFINGHYYCSLLTEQQLTSLRAEKIGYIFQETNLIQALTLQENLEFAQSLGKKSKTEPQEITALLERLGLAERKDFLPYQLSGGQKRRAMAARALINHPALILAWLPITTNGQQKQHLNTE